MDSKDGFDGDCRISAKSSKSAGDDSDAIGLGRSARHYMADAKETNDSNVIITKRDLMSKDSYDDLTSLLTHNSISSSSSGAAAMVPLPEPELSSHEVAQHMVKGLRINYMSMRYIDGTTVWLIHYRLSSCVETRRTRGRRCGGLLSYGATICSRGSTRRPSLKAYCNARQS